jgi:polyadenylate-binding protein
VTEMNGKIIATKPLYVALAQRKEDRKAQLASQYMQRLASIRMHNAGALPGTMYTPGSGGFFVSSAAAAMQNQRAAFMPTATMPATMRGTAPRWNTLGGATANFNAAPRGVAQSPYMVQSQGYGAARGPRPAGPGGAMRPQTMQQYQAGVARVGAQQQQRMPGMVQQQRPQQPQMMQQQRMQAAPQGMVANAQKMYQYGVPRPAQPTQAQQYQQPTQAGIVVQGQEPLTAHMLAQAQPQEQKQMLGERIFPLIERMYNGQESGKITGMLLEMDNSELLMMLESEDLLRSKVNEAVAVLQSSKHAEGNM